MSRYHHLSTEKSPAIKLAARQRVDAVWTCLDVLCPDLALEAKKILAEKVLDLSRGEERKSPRIMINPAQVQEIVWQHSQCANRNCPMVLFSQEMAEELNEGEE